MTPTNKNAIGIAIAGLGFGESVHLPAINSHQELKVVALWHPNKERVEIASKKHQINGISNWQEVLLNPEVQGIVIATPPHVRFQLAMEALEAGKHLFLEKPVALNANQIAQLQKIAIKSNLSVAVDFEYRAVPLFMKAKRLIDEGFLGTPWLVKLDWLMSSRANPSREWNWYSEADKGGGVIGALGTHAFDMIHWLCGPIENVKALQSTSIRSRFDPNIQNQREVTSEDIALAQFEIIHPDSSLTVPAQITLSAVARHGRGCWLEIYGSEGTLILGSENQNDYVHGFGLWGAASNEQLRNITPDEDLTFKTTWKDGRIAPVARIHDWWAKSIVNQSPMVPGLSEGLESQLICDKLKQISPSTSKQIIKF